MKKFIFLFFFLLLTTNSFATTWYVRSDGSNDTNCTGKVDAAYPGSGTAQPCAFNHPYYALGWNGGAGSSQKILGGDTLIIGDSGNDPGSFKFGYDTTFAWSGCSTFFPYDCYPRAVPSGPDVDHKTKIYGRNWQDCSNRDKMTEIWGAERIQPMINMISTDNAEVQCLEVTDHEQCAEFGPTGFSCPRSSYPYGNWSPRGFTIKDSENIYLKNLWVHGLAGVGIRASRVKDILVENVSIIGNGAFGWDSDDGDPDTWADAGHNIFKNLNIEWTGCTERYPYDPSNPLPVDDSCCTTPQASSCSSSDGFVTSIGGIYTNQEVTYEFIDSSISHNTSDGLDAIYQRGGNANFILTRFRAEGNVGNQVKMSGNVLINDSFFDGKCGFFSNKPYKHVGDGGFVSCRGYDGTVVWNIKNAGNHFEMYGSTVTGHADTQIIEYSVNGSSICDGSEYMKIRNSILLGQTRYLNSVLDVSDDIYIYGYNGSGSCVTGFNLDWDGPGAGNIVYNSKAPSPCPSAGITCSDPKLQDKINNWAEFQQLHINFTPRSDSPAIGLRNSAFGNSTDFNNVPRNTTIGAAEASPTEGVLNSSGTFYGGTISK